MGGILATIMIIVGTLATPVVMQTLFAQGHAFTGASGNFATIVNLGSRSLYGPELPGWGEARRFAPMRSKR